MILFLDSFNEYPYPDKDDVLTQIQYIYRDAFGISYWEPLGGLQLVLDMVDKKVHGLLSLYHPNNQVGEIYNVCTHPNYRNQGVMKRMFAKLPPKFYYIQASFSNPIAYSAYSRYFTRFQGIGRLTYGGEVSFVFGGTPTISNKTPDEVIARIAQVATTIDMPVYTRHFVRYADAYEFVLQHSDIVRQVHQLYNSHIRLSREVGYVMSFSGDLLESCIDMFQLMQNSYVHGLGLV